MHAALCADGRQVKDITAHRGCCGGLQIVAAEPCVPIQPFRIALWHAATLLVEPAQIDLGMYITGLCSKTVPFCSFRIALRNSIASFVHHPEIILGNGASLHCLLAINLSKSRFWMQYEQNKS